MKRLAVVTGVAMLASFGAAPAQADENPYPSVNRIAKEVGCPRPDVHVEETSLIAIKFATCTTKDGLKEVMIESFPSLGKQARMVTLWEQEVIIKNWKPYFYMARCHKYNVSANKTFGNGNKKFAKEYVKSHKGCVLQYIDGKTWS